ERRAYTLSVPRALGTMAKRRRTMEERIYNWYHGSADDNLVVVDDSGRFGSFLFFTGDERTPFGEFNYAVDENDLDICEACQLSDDDDIIEEVMRIFGCSEDVADDLLDESITWIQLEGYEFDGDDQWELQHLQA